MNGAGVIVEYAIRESVRRRVFVVVLLLTLAFLALYALGVRQAFQELDEFTAGTEAAAVLDSVTVAGTTLFGLSLFAILFLGAVLAVFLTLNVVRGDAERGLLQPLVVRPVGRTTHHRAAACYLYREAPIVEGSDLSGVLATGDRAGAVGPPAEVNR